MSDWDADSDEGSSSKPVKTAAAVAAPATAATMSYGRRKFEDEDLEDQVKDDWEEDEDEDDRKVDDISSLQPIKKKSTVKQKIKEREEEERRRAEMGDESDDDILEDPIEKRRRERAAQMEADIANAANLLGTSKINQENGSDNLRTAKPESKEDWEKFASDIYTSLIKTHSTKPGYSKHFIPAFTKHLSDNLRDVDCRKLSTDWKKIGEDKLKAEREKKANPAGKKKPEKPKTVGTASAKNKIDTSAYGDEALGDDDDLDFM